MGADLITAVAVWPKDMDLDWEAGKRIATTVVEADVARNVLDGELCYTLEADDEGRLTQQGVADLRDAMENAVEVAESVVTQQWRNTAQYTLFGHNVLILGETSWGDGPEGYSELVCVLDTPKVAEAIGFTLDCYK